LFHFNNSHNQGIRIAVWQAKCNKRPVKGV
jgi:hypothetical protein